MIIITQIILIAAALSLVGVSLSGRNSLSWKAWRKVGLILLATAMIIAILYPNITNRLANLAGVGRGTDMLLYVTVATFIYYAINNYLKQQDQMDGLFRMARKIALVEAKEKYKID